MPKEWLRTNDRWLEEQKFCELAAQYGLWPVSRLPGVLEVLERSRLLRPVARIRWPATRLINNEHHDIEEREWLNSGLAELERRLVAFNSHQHASLLHPYDDPATEWRHFIVYQDDPSIDMADVTALQSSDIRGLEKPCPLDIKTLYHGWQIFVLAAILERGTLFKLDGAAGNKTAKWHRYPAGGGDALAGIVAWSRCLECVSLHAFHWQHLDQVILKRNGWVPGTRLTSAHDEEIVKLARSFAAKSEIEARDLRGFIRYQDVWHRRLVHDNAAERTLDTFKENIRDAIGLLCSLEGCTPRQVIDELAEQDKNHKPSLAEMFPDRDRRLREQVLGTLDAAPRADKYGGAITAKLIFEINDQILAERFVDWMLQEKFYAFLEFIDVVWNPRLRYTDQGRTRLSATAVGMGAMLEHLVVTMLQRLGTLKNKEDSLTKQMCELCTGTSYRLPNWTTNYTSIGKQQKLKIFGKSLEFFLNKIENEEGNSEQKILVKALVCRNKGMHEGFSNLPSEQIWQIIKLQLFAAFVCFRAFEERRAGAARTAATP